MVREQYCAIGIYKIARSIVKLSVFFSESSHFYYDGIIYRDIT